MKSIKDMSLQELGSFICSALKVEDIHVVLSGGSCVEIYSRGEYTSWDLDLINQYNEQFKKIHVIIGKAFSIIVKNNEDINKFYNKKS